MPLDDRDLEEPRLRELVARVEALEGRHARLRRTSILATGIAAVALTVTAGALVVSWRTRGASAPTQEIAKLSGRSRAGLFALPAREVQDTPTRETPALSAEHGAPRDPAAPAARDREPPAAAIGSAVAAATPTPPAAPTPIAHAELADIAPDPPPSGHETGSLVPHSELPVEPSGPASGGLHLQVAATENPTEAADVAQGLRSRGYAAFVLAPGPGDGWYRVRIGGLESRPAASQMARELAEAGFPGAWITSQTARTTR
jgi:cell division septation protein DedD